MSELQLGALDYQNIIHESSEGFFLLDEEGRIIEWNPKLEEITGFFKKDVQGLYFWDVPPLLFDAIGHEDFKGMVLQALETGKGEYIGKAFEVVIDHPGGLKKYLHQRVFTFKTESGRRMGGTSRDVTQKKLLKNELYESQNTLDNILQSQDWYRS